MEKIKFALLFLLINFSGLWIGTILMNNGPTANWYLSLNKAPWTPPGWVFGAAWSTIMVCFSIYLTYLFNRSPFRKKITFAFVIAFILNVSWNYFFFNKHLVTIGLINLVLLNILLCYFFFSLKQNMERIRFLLTPYLIWMCIATSLNLYILIHN